MKPTPLLYHTSNRIRVYTRTTGVAMLILHFLFLSLLSASGQNASKQGGVCFRVDNNPSLTKVHQYDSVFSKYQQKFCVALTSWVLPIAPIYVDSIRSWITRGHEVMDNTPTHQTQFFKVLNTGDTSLYSGNPGVDHFNNQTVCLKVSSIDTSQSYGEGLVNISGNLVISLKPGDFSDLNGNPYFFALYLSGPVKKLVLWYDLHAANPNDLDSVYVKSFWEEPLNLGTKYGVHYHKLTQRSVIMTQDAILLLGKRTLKIYQDLAIPRPYTWIHPAGQMPWISGNELKWNMGDSLQFAEGSNFINYSKLCYNEFSLYHIAPFGIQSGELSNETQPLQTSKKIIANAIARHYVKIDVAQFQSSNGWNAFLQRTDSLLSWCSVNNIPVRTYKQWKILLYDSIPNRLAEVFPKLNIDLDKDSFPDGFDQSPDLTGVYDSTDGVSTSGGRCFVMNGNGKICQVSSLAGLETGLNKFTIWTKGNNTDTSKITVRFEFPEQSKIQIMEFNTDTALWIKHTQMLDVPDSVSFMNVLFSHNDLSPDTVKISGLSLCSAGFLNRTSYPSQTKVANETFASIDLNTWVIDTLISPDSVAWTVKYNDTMNLAVLPGNILKVQKPVSFWVGADSAFVIAQSPEGIRDSCKVSFKSTPIPGACAGLPITLTLLDTLENDIIQWTSVPHDSTISDPGIYNPTVNPKITTIYRVLVINPLGPVNRDSITIVRYPFPAPNLKHDTSTCIGNPITLTASGGVHYLWSTGDSTASITVTPTITTTYKVLVTSDHACSSSDSSIVSVLPLPVVSIYGLSPTYCQTDPPVPMSGLPPGGTFSSTTTAIINNVFYPNLSDPGKNYIWYSFADLNGCRNSDTARVIINPRPNIQNLPDTSLCANYTITLHAGSGFDNYLWSNGSTDSTIVVDSTGYGLGVTPFWVYVTLNGCVDKDTGMVTFIICPIGFPDHEISADLHIFPNPATDEITFYATKLIGTLVHIEILDPSGRIILLERKVIENINKINLTGLSKGLYLFRVTSGNKAFLYRFVKN